ncbi:MAG TPA: hypothetical protein PK939_10895 [Bacteroidales bacterium]|nr:hypothetical protein [Bacteroidales bacterium]
MNKNQDYISDIAAIRVMMERSSKFLSLSGWAGVMAGLYALVGAYLAHQLVGFVPPDTLFTVVDPAETELLYSVALAIAVLIFSILSAAYLSHRRAERQGESIRNSSSKQMLLHMAPSLVAGGLLTLILLLQGLAAFAAPLTLLFYGLSLFNASQFTFNELRYLGILLITLGLASVLLPHLGLLFWAIGFGLLHIVYGVYIHMKYQR